MMLGLTLRSMLGRKVSIALTVVTLALSVALFLTVERMRIAVQESFDGSVSGVDVLVGARGSELSLLLYTVFQIGDAAPSMRWTSFEEVVQDDRVDWAVPISLGDSHRRYRVIATTSDYFEHVRVGRNRPLAFRAKTDSLLRGFGVVLGAEVVRALGYQIGDALTIQHGLASAGDESHKHQPFIVTGILEATGTPVDYGVLVHIRAFEAIHEGWTGSVPGTGLDRHEGITDRTAIDLSGPDFEPSLLTAVYVGLKSKRRIFQFIEDIEDRDRSEPLTGVLPGITLSQLWLLLATAESAMLLFSVLIVLVALAGQMTLLVATLDLRRREIAIYRAMGAQPITVAVLLVLESMVISVCAAGLGLVLTLLGTLTAGQVLGGFLKLELSAVTLSAGQVQALLAFVVVSAVTGLIPAFMAYRTSLQDGMRARF
ncbi:MAG: ABC transporter permease [Alphaproteobacteria bacterium TMED89]|nr:peptide ABC transporter permease [Rhodospirillaceae bacterium]RPH15477.1 MAG: ABC transporter permease [Alphaproteobacteria bacterium TMED89]